MAVTASREAAAGTAAELVAVGLQAIGLPCVRMQVGSDADLARARAAAEEAGLIVLISSRALDVLWPVADIPTIPIATLGPVSAARAEERGGRVLHKCRVGQRVNTTQGFNRTNESVTRRPSTPQNIGNDREPTGPKGIQSA